MRLDKYLTDNNFFPSREKAQTAIKHETVMVDGHIVTKASMDITESMRVEVIDLFNKYVSMGGLKLEKAIKDFGLDFAGKSVLDIGASTGGFTDCALQHGAASVTAVDVGTAQLVKQLRKHPKVTVFENKDFRDLTIEDVDNQKFDFIVSDVSFISLTYIIPYIDPFLRPDGQMMFLVSEAMNHHYYLKDISVSTLFEKHKNVEFLALFSRQPQRYAPDYNRLFLDVKELRKQL